jgi:Ala-tRNA(Pro) deacylase
MHSAHARTKKREQGKHNHYTVQSERQNSDSLMTRNHCRTNDPHRIMLSFTARLIPRRNEVYSSALEMRYNWRPVVAAVRNWVTMHGCGCVELPLETVDEEFGRTHFAPRAGTLVIRARDSGCDSEPGKFVLLLKPAHARVDMRAVRNAAGAESARAASLGEVHLATRCRPGCVPPLGSLFDLPVLIDARIAEAAEIFVPSGQPGFVIMIRTRDLLRTEKAVIV